MAHHLSFSHYSSAYVNAATLQPPHAVAKSRTKLNCSRRLHLPICLVFHLHYAPSCLSQLYFPPLEFGNIPVSLKTKLSLSHLLFLLSPITPGSSPLREFISPIFSDTASLLVTLQWQSGRILPKAWNSKVFFFCQPPLSVRQAAAASSGLSECTKCELYCDDTVCSEGTFFKPRIWLTGHCHLDSLQPQETIFG